METLEERYKDDPQLLKFYKKKLPRRGWAGQKDAVEREYIKRRKAGQINGSPPLHS